LAVALAFQALSLPLALAAEGASSALSNAEEDTRIRQNIESFCAKCIGEPIQSVRLTVKSQKNPSTQRNEDLYLINNKHGFSADCETGLITGYTWFGAQGERGGDSADVGVNDKGSAISGENILGNIAPFLNACGLPQDMSEYQRTDNKFMPNTAIFNYRYSYGGVPCLGSYAMVHVSLKTGRVLIISMVPIFVPPAEPQHVLAPCDAVDAMSKWLLECSETRKTTYRITLTVQDCKKLTKVIAPHGGLLGNRGGGRTDLAYCWVVPFELLEQYSGSWHGPWPCEAYVSCSSGIVIGDSIGPPIHRDQTSK
jgi:hypothetical protein